MFSLAPLPLSCKRIKIKNNKNQNPALKKVHWIMNSLLAYIVVLVRYRCDMYKKRLFRASLKCFWTQLNTSNALFSYEINSYSKLLKLPDPYRPHFSIIYKTTKYNAIKKWNVIESRHLEMPSIKNVFSDCIKCGLKVDSVENTHMKLVKKCPINNPLNSINYQPTRECSLLFSNDLEIETMERKKLLIF